jgi:RNA polymerase sigma factor (sigma-70 family)
MGEAGDLVQRARGGDRAAWDALVARYSRLVLSVARAQGLREADREDVGQVVWLKLAQNLDRLANPDAVGAWLATTSRRESLRLGARSAREIPSEGELFHGIADKQDVEATVLRNERDRQLWAGFGRLSERCQSLLRLIVEEWPYEEISRTLDMPIGGIGPTRQRCLDKLRALLPEAVRISGLSTDS